MNRILFALFCFLTVPAFAQVTDFTYQGRLNENASPADGLYDLRVALYDSATGGTTLAVATNASTSVSNGLFTVQLDFGAELFNGGARWLEVGVRTNGSADPYTTLNPRHPVTAAPYAIQSANALTAVAVTGTISDSQLSSNVARLNVSQNFSGSVSFNNASGNFSGNGAGLTNVNAATLNGLSSAGFWKTGGNSGTTPGANFIGTTDNQPFEIKINNSRVMRFQNGNFGPNIVAGHWENSASNASYAVIAGGGQQGGPNTVTANYGSILGGAFNYLSCYGGTIAGGLSNTNSGGVYSVIGGGQRNFIFESGSATIAGGANNTVQTNAHESVIGGGINNIIKTNSLQAVIGGGVQNKIERDAGFSVIAGGSGNLTTAGWSTIGGGDNNTNYSTGGFIGGGKWNVTSNDFSAAAGGLQNAARGTRSFVGGGHQNKTTGAESVIAGGQFNSIGNNGFSAVIGGGAYNTNTAAYSTIGGGSGNTVSANLATVPGGYMNSATSFGSFAAGMYARANHQASFVWNDNFVEFASTGPKQFLINATGGVGIGTASPASALDVNGIVTAAGFSGPLDANHISSGTLDDARLSLNVVRVNGSPSFTSPVTAGSGLRLSDSKLYLRGGSDLFHGIGWYASGTFATGNPDGPVIWGCGGGALGTYCGSGGLTNKIALVWNASGNVGIGNPNPGALLQVGSATCNGTTWANASDRNLKANFAPVEPEEILQRLETLAITSWNYTNDSGVRHIGPMAQDFHAAFGLGNDDKQIATVDADGIALVAIKGLNEKLKEKDAEIADLKARLARLEKLLLQ